MAKTHPLCPSVFRAQAFELACTSGKGMPQFAHELGLSEQVLRGWLKRADINARRVDDGGAGLYSGF
jgi:transposase-like protein